MKSDDDVCTVHVDQVKAILPPPLSSGSTARTKGVLAFNVNFGKNYVEIDAYEMKLRCFAYYSK